MILTLSFRFAGSIHRYLYAYAPSNVLIRHLRSPAGRKWAAPISAAVTAGYLAVGVGLTAVIDSGGPGWLNLVVLTCAWNAIKFMWLTALSIPSILARALRHVARRWERRSFDKRGPGDLGHLIR